MMINGPSPMGRGRGVKYSARIAFGEIAFPMSFTTLGSSSSPGSALSPASPCRRWDLVESRRLQRAFWAERLIALQVHDNIIFAFGVDAAQRLADAVKPACMRPEVIAAWPPAASTALTISVASVRDNWT